MASSTHDAVAPNGAGEAYDRRLAAEAVRKMARGEPLTVREQTALKRYEKERDENLRWKHYATIPQKHWRRMSGRQTKVINEQAVLYGIPFGGPTINLCEVVKALHDFLAANARKLSADYDLLGSDTSSPALERYREERAAIAKLDRLERERQLVRRDDVRMGLARVANILQTAGDLLAQHYGPGAAEIVTEALSDAEREVDRWFGDEPPPMTELQSSPTDEHRDE
jgi:hypothetical protein